MLLLAFLALSSPILVLSLLLPPDIPLINSIQDSIDNVTANPLEVLCYDARYATHRPTVSDCATIIQHQIAKPAATIHRVRSFSRQPTAYQLPLPQTWNSKNGECNVTIDIPTMNPTEVAMASLMDIKRAAFEVLLNCVFHADHLGGLTQIGRDRNLQVRVEAGDKSKKGMSE